MKLFEKRGRAESRPALHAWSRRWVLTGLLGGGRLIALASSRLGLLCASVDGRITYDVTRFGARGDGVTLCTAAIQRSIDLCAAQGGAVVRVPAGNYVIGTLLLKNGITLHLDRDAVLLGSLDPQDYRLVDSFVDGVNSVRGYTLIGAMDKHDIGIEGPGTIDGRGA